MIARRWANGIVAVLAALLWVTPVSAEDYCRGAPRELLKRTGHDVDCGHVKQTIKYVGRTKPGRGGFYRVYLLTYQTMDPGLASHYGQRILIFDPHLNFLGEYHLETGHRLGVAGSDVVLLNVPADQGNRLHLGGGHPPASAWLDGDQVGFAH